MEEGDYDSAATQLKESLALCCELGDRRYASVSLFTLGIIELARDLDRGAAMLEENTRIARELGDRLMGAYSVLAMGKVAALRGRPSRVATMWGAAEALREQMGMTFSHFDLAHFGYERDLDAVRSMLPETSFDVAWAEERAMSPKQAIDYALDQPTRPHEKGAHPRTRRELGILRLVARNMSNRRSPRTST